MKKLVFRAVLGSVLMFSVCVSTLAAEFLIPVGKVVGLSLAEGSVTVAAFDETLGAAARAAGLEQYRAMQQCYSYLFMENGVKLRYPFNENVDFQRLRYLKDKKMPLVAYACLAKGGYVHPEKLPAGYIRGNRLNVIQEMARDKGVGVNALVLKWLSSARDFSDHPQVIPLFGTGTPEHLADNLASMQIELTAEEFALLSDAR